MSSRKRKKKTRYDKKRKLWPVIAAVIVVLALAAAVVIYAMTGSPSSDGSQGNASSDEVPEVDLELENRVEAPYEHWLSAAVLTGISIEYPSFEPGGFYTAGETTIEDKTSSAGVYVIFSADGEEKCIRSTPLEAERSDAGTKDIYSETIGFATFEEVDVSEIPEGFSAVDIDNIDELITQSTRVAVYSH